MTTAPSKPRASAPAAALALASDCGAEVLARAAGRPAGGARLIPLLLAHELAAGHCLTMRLAAQANAFLDRAGPGSPDGRGERAAQEAVRLAGGAARLMERYRQGALALARLRLDLRAAAEPKVIVRQVYVRPDGGALPRLTNGGPFRITGGYDPGSSGSSGGSGTPPPGSGPGPAGSPPPRTGQLRHGNPSGDLSAVARCGARTRAGTACRQPAMANGRCRLHGGKSTGPRTAEGLERARRARLVHGARRRDLLALRSAAAHSARRLSHLTRLSRDLLAGHGVHGPDSRPSQDSAQPRAASTAVVPATPDLIRGGTHFTAHARQWDLAQVTPHRAFEPAPSVTGRRGPTVGMTPWGRGGGTGRAPN